MALGSIIQFLEKRSILVTGATGFLAKIYVEKILRVQPNVKKIYLLMRASDTRTAMQRFENEVISRDLFRVLKDKYGNNFNSFISEKVKAVSGDISYDNLGVNDCELLEEMWNEVDVVINLAATTKFYERYDVSLGINTMGAKNVLNFSKKCAKLKVLVHVSTAYVSGEKEGLILETPYTMGETLNGTRGLDIESEKKLIEDTLRHMKAENYSEEAINSTMKDLGIQRARKFGWPNTYVFTKALGEMLLGELKENIPLVIIRPTIITSTFNEPFPGWAEGVRTIDSLAVGYGKGRLQCFLGNPTTILDLIPADMVVNAMMVSMAAHANQPAETIYHIGSSASNPCTATQLQDFSARYFMNNPWINKEGKAVKVRKVKLLTSMESFQTYFALHYVLPLKGLQALNAVCCRYFQGLYLDLHRKITMVMQLIELYRPYLFFEGCFDDTNTEKLRIATKESDEAEKDIFYFDPKVIDWDEYFYTTHFPGIVQHVFN